MRETHMSTALKASPEHGLSPGTALRDPGRQPWGQLPTLVTVNTKQRSPEPSPRRAGGVAHLCIPSARTRDTRSIFVGKFVKGQVPPPSLSDSLCLEVSGTRARSQIPPRRGWGVHGPSCVSCSPRPSPSTSDGVWDPASCCALTCQARPFPRGGALEPLREEGSLGG